MKTILAIIVSTITTSLYAETLSFPSFQIDIQDSWERSIENRPGDDLRNMVSLRHPNGVGILKIGSYDALTVVSQDILRNMTNLESSIPLPGKTGETIRVTSMTIWNGVHSIDSGSLRVKGRSYLSPTSAIPSQKILKLKRSTILFAR